MKIVKRILIWIGIFILVLLQIGIFLPHEYRIEKSLWIDQDPEVIFPYIENLQKWEEWTTWNKKDDPTYIGFIDGKTEGEGAIKRWESKKNGDGTIEIMLDIKDKLITYDLTMTKDGFISNGKIELIEMDGGTNVIWAEEGDFGYNLIGRYMGILMENFAGNELETSLINLKRICETP